MSSSKLIDGEKLTAFERWELPHMGQHQQEKTKVEEVELDEVQPFTAEQLAEIEDAARKEGHAKGFEQGQKEGLAAGKKQIDDAARRLEKIIKAFTQPMDEVDETVEEELLALALVVARQVIRREILQDPQLILAVVREAMSELPTAARQVRLYLHPDDATLVREISHADDGEERAWKIVDDVTISRGGCRIESQTSRIDASVEKRLETVVANIFGDRDNELASSSEADESSNGKG